MADSTQTQQIEALMTKLAESSSKNVTIDYYFGKDGFPTWLERKLQSIHGTASSHLLDAQDMAGPRAVVTAWKE